MSEVTGELGGQPILLENAATESTLQLLLQATLANSSNKSKAAQIQKLYEEALTKSTKSKYDEIKALEEEEKLREDLNRLLDKETARRKAVVEDLQTSMKRVAAFAGAMFSTAAPKITDFTNALEGIPILGPLFAAAGKIIQDNVEAVRKVSSTGADLGGSLMSIRSNAARAGVALDDYVDIVTRNSQAFARLSGNVATGTRVFNDISGVVQRKFGGQLAALGFSMAEISENIAGYIDIQSQLGHAQKMSQTELINGAAAYNFELDQMAKATGIERKALQDKIKQAAEDKRIRALQIDIGRQGGNVAKAFGMLKEKLGPMADGLFDIMLNEGNAMTGMGKSLTQYSSSAVDVMMQFKRDGDISKLMRGLGQVGAELEQSGEGFGGTLGLFTNVLSHKGNQMLDAFGFIPELKSLAQGLEPAAEQQRQIIEKNGRAAMGLDRMILNIRNLFVNIMAPLVNYFEKHFASIMGLLGKYATQFVNWITGLLDMLQDTGSFKPVLTQAVRDIMNNAAPILAEALKGLFLNPLVIGALVTTIGTMMFVAGAAGAVGRGVAGAGGALAERAIGGLTGSRRTTVPDVPDTKPGFMKTAEDKIRDRQSAKDAGGKGNKGGSKIADGVSGVTGGLLEGMANGLAAFGAKAPLILLGATTFSAATAIIIAGVGAGLAAASYLIGSSLPKLTEGMKSLESLDGNALQSAGLGIAAVAGGLAVFAVGGAAASASSVFSSFIDGLGGLFGAKSPLEKLKAFAAAGDDLGRSAQGFTAFKLAITDMPFDKLAFSDNQLKSLELGTARVKGLSNALSQVREEMKAVTQPSLTETLTATIKDVGTAISNKIAGTKEKGKSVEALMTDLNEKVDLLNTNMLSLVEIQERVAPDVRRTARNTRDASGRV